MLPSLWTSAAHLPADLLGLLTRRIWLAGSLLAVLAAVAITVFSLHAANAVASVSSLSSARPVVVAGVPVSVATVARSEVTGWTEFSGRMEAVERVDIRSRVAGTVRAVHFREGALVKRGDLLLTIDPAPYAAEVDRATAQVAAAQARATYSHSEAARSQRLLDEHAIAQREHDERSNALLEADANLHAAQAALQTARLSPDYTQVRTPVAGRTAPDAATTAEPSPIRQPPWRPLDLSRSRWLPPSAPAAT